MSLYNPFHKRPYTILVEASKLAMEKNDGCKRYVSEITMGLLKHHQQADCPWVLEFHVEGRIFSAEQLEQYIAQPQSNAPINIASEEPAPGFFKRFRSNAKKMSYSMLSEKQFKRLEKWQYVAKMKKRNLTSKYLKLKMYLFSPQKKYDLIHLTLPYTPRYIASKSKNFITTIHDFTHIYYPQFHVRQNVINSQKGIDFSQKVNSWWIAISKSTKSDLQKFCTVEESKIFTIYEAADNKRFHGLASPEEKLAMRKKYNIPENARYILSLSTLEPRKNIHNTIKAFHELSKELKDSDLYLVIAGRMGWLMEELLKDNGIKSDKIIFTGFVAEKDLPVIYADALALSYVSFYEGFGLPPLEAMSSGTPVIYGNNSSQREIIGNAGIAADAHSVASIKEAMKQIVMDNVLRKQMEKKARERAQEFSWEKCVNETVEAYKKVLGI